MYFSLVCIIVTIIGTIIGTIMDDIVSKKHFKGRSFIVLVANKKQFKERNFIVLVLIKNEFINYQVGNIGFMATNMFVKCISFSKIVEDIHRIGACIIIVSTVGCTFQRIDIIL